MITAVLFFLVKWVFIAVIAVVLLVLIALLVPLKVKIGARTEPEDGKMVDGTLVWFFGLIRARFDISKDGSSDFDLSIVGFKVFGAE
jgi:hypothetical protein